MRTLVQTIPFLFFSLFLSTACSMSTAESPASDASCDLVTSATSERFVARPTLPPDPRTIDRDSDGATADEDCDDEDPHRAPSLKELCDGIDNNCDGKVDEGYGVDELCMTGDDCQPIGRMRCNDDLVSSSCQWDDTGCL